MSEAPGDAVANRPLVPADGTVLDLAPTDDWRTWLAGLTRAASVAAVMILGFRARHLG